MYICAWDNSGEKSWVFGQFEQVNNLSVQTNQAVLGLSGTLYISEIWLYASCSMNPVLGSQVYRFHSSIAIQIK